MGFTKETIREMEHGPTLNALCCETFGWPWEIRDEGVFRTDPNVSYGFFRMDSWTAAGPALEWLGSRPEWSADLNVEGGVEASVSVWLDFGGECDIYVEATTPCLAIARAVCLVGLRERPDEMQAAWEAMQPPRAAGGE